MSVRSTFCDLCLNNSPRETRLLVTDLNGSEGVARVQIFFFFLLSILGFLKGCQPEETRDSFGPSYKKTKLIAMQC